MVLYLWPFTDVLLIVWSQSGELWILFDLSLDDSLEYHQNHRIYGISSESMGIFGILVELKGQIIRKILRRLIEDKF